MKRRWLLVPALVAVAAAIVQLRRPDPWTETLRAVEEAPRRNDYDATVVLTTIHKEVFETRIRVQHRNGARDVFILDGWRRGDGEWKTPRLPLDERKPMKLPHRRRINRTVLDAELAAKNHSILELPREMVAGREARVLDLRPRTAGRPSYRLWIDAALGIALGLESQDAGGNLISRWKFEAFEPLAPAGTPEPDERMELQTLLAQKPYPLWVPAAPPEGYEFHGARVHEREDRTSVTLAYTDGMNVISVIQRNPTGEPWKPEMERSSEGKPVVHRWNWYGTRILKVRLGDTFVTVVGHDSPESLTDMIRTMVEHR